VTIPPDEPTYTTRPSDDTVIAVTALSPSLSTVYIMCFVALPFAEVGRHRTLMADQVNTRLRTS
jgi:hypothetical protein